MAKYYKVGTEIYRTLKEATDHSKFTDINVIYICKTTLTGNLTIVGLYRRYNDNKWVKKK